MSGLLRKTLCSLRPAVTANVSQKATYVFGPPKFRVPIMFQYSFFKKGSQEKYMLFSGAAVIMLGPMTWVMINIEHYKKKDE